MKFKPYVSIDLEFTSLHIPDSQIIEIGAVYDDGVSEIKDLPTFSAVIHYDKFTNPQLGAVVINGNLLKELYSLSSEQKKGATAANVLAVFDAWLESLRTTNSETGKLERLTVAGKNAAGGDIPILKNNCIVNSVPDITNKFTHRTLDVGSMYFDHFGENVTLGEINKLTGRSAEVSHRALDDAFDVVYGIRHKMQMKQKAIEEAFRKMC